MIRVHGGWLEPGEAFEGLEPAPPPEIALNPAVILAVGPRDDGCYIEFVGDSRTFFAREAYADVIRGIEDEVSDVRWKLSDIPSALDRVGEAIGSLRFK